MTLKWGLNPLLLCVTQVPRTLGDRVAGDHLSSLAPSFPLSRVSKVALELCRVPPSSNIHPLILLSRGSLHISYQLWTPELCDPPLSPYPSAVGSPWFQVLGIHEVAQETTLQVAPGSSCIKLGVGLSQQQGQGDRKSRHIHWEGSVGLPRRVEAHNPAILYSRALESQAAHQPHRPH